MNQKELTYRITRLGRERTRLQKAIAKKILKLTIPLMEEWPNHQNTLFIFSRGKSQSLREDPKEYGSPKQSWSRAKYFYLNDEYEFCGVTPDGVIVEINALFWAPMPFDALEPRDLMRVLSVCEKVIKSKRYVRRDVCLADLAD